MLPGQGTPQEYSKFLYDAGLQNVFDNYQRNIQSLNQNEQKSLQDAYYIREMSKRYLGEYASNVGIGDVSGNLLDVYSQYQGNISQIQQNYDTLALNMQNAFDSEQQNLFREAMSRQIQIAEQDAATERQQLAIDAAQAESEEQQAESEAAQQQLNNARQIQLDISMGNTGDMGWKQYLDSKKADGSISESQYTALLAEAYSSALEVFNRTLESQNFGFKTGPDGKLVPKTVQEFLEENRGWLSARDYASISKSVLYGTQNPGPRVDTTVSPFEPNDVVRGSYADMFGDNAFQMDITVDGNINTYVSTNQVAPTSVATELNKRINDRGGAFMSGQTVEMLNGNYYMFVEGREGGEWVRMQNITPTLTQISSFMNSTTKDGKVVPAEASKWADGEGGWNINGTRVVGDVTFNLKTNGWEMSVQWNGAEYKHDSAWYESAGANKYWVDPRNPNAGPKTPLQIAYESVHGAERKQNAFFYYEGHFYALDKKGSQWSFRRFSTTGTPRQS